MKEASGYSGTPLAKKLGFKDGFKIKILNEPAYYFALFESFLPNCQFSTNENGPFDIVHAFVVDASNLDTLLAELKKEIAPNGCIWISWYKKSAKKNSDITEDLIRKLAIENGLVDVKVCAIDELWSGLKLVIPVKSRLKT